MSPVAALERSAPSRHFLDTGHEATRAPRYGFRIGDLGLLLGERVFCEVTAVPTAARIPGTPNWLLGVMNLRGSLVPVFDLHELFELPQDRRLGGATGLVIDRGEHAVAIVTDELPRPLRSLHALTEPPPLPAGFKPFVSASWVQEREVWIDFDHRQLFASLVARIDASAGKSALGLP